MNSHPVVISCLIVLVRALAIQSVVTFSGVGFISQPRQSLRQVRAQSVALLRRQCPEDAAPLGSDVLLRRCFVAKYVLLEEGAPRATSRRRQGADAEHRVQQRVKGGI